MNSSKFFALIVISCMLSVDLMLPVVLAGHHGRGNHGIELLLAAGILAKLLRKKGHHHHHHHGHHHHGHHEHHGSGSHMAEMFHLAPPMGGYSSHYHPSAQSSYSSPSAAATTSFSASIEYPYAPAASHPVPMPHMPPYGGPVSAASFIGYEPQPLQYGPPMPEQQPLHVH